MLPLFNFCQFDLWGRSLIVTLARISPKVAECLFTPISTWVSLHTCPACFSNGLCLCILFLFYLSNSEIEKLNPPLQRHFVRLYVFSFLFFHVCICLSLFCPHETGTSSLRITPSVPTWRPPSCLMLSNLNSVLYLKLRSLPVFICLTYREETKESD